MSKSRRKPPMRMSYSQPKDIKIGNENSHTIGRKMNHLMQRIKAQEILAMAGYIRQIMSYGQRYQIHKIPVDIMNYCIVYAFLVVNEWCKVDSYKYVYKFDNEYLVAEIVRNYNNFGWQTLIANPIVSQGTYEWKVRIRDDYGDFEDDNYYHNPMYVHIGLTTKNMVKGDEMGYINLNDEAMDEIMTYKWGINISPFYSSGDIVTLHLDLDNKVIKFWNNDEYIGIALENVKKDNYRLIVCVHANMPPGCKIELFP